MNRELCLVVAALLCIAVLLCGCQEQQQTWGKGELPPAWQELFGDDNGSRMDYAQVEAINKQVADVNSLDARIDALEALNSEQHRKLGETDIRFHGRMEALEESQPEPVNVLVDGQLNPFENEITFTAIDSPIPLPYIYDDPIERDPNILYVIGYPQSDTVCTKHGRLKNGNRWVFSDEKGYCADCVCEVAEIYLNKHIGTDPNE